MLVEQLKEQWICSCGNWVDLAVTWRLTCCEDREFKRLEEKEKNQVLAILNPKSEKKHLPLFLPSVMLKIT